MKKKPFQDFLTKTSRIIERALDNQFDVIGDFFAEDEDEENARMNRKREKIQQQFIFQPNQHLKRAVTSMDWSPKVSDFTFLCLIDFYLRSVNS